MTSKMGLQKNINNKCRCKIKMSTFNSIEMLNYKKKKKDVLDRIFINVNMHFLKKKMKFIQLFELINEHLIL